MLGFQLLILLTGNYGFFNLLTMLLCVFLFDDAALRRLVPVRLASWIGARAPRPGGVATAVAAGLALIVVPVGLDPIWQPLTRTDLPLAGRLTEAISPLLIVNPYGLFVTTTTTRPEIIIEGSEDGQIWREYVFRYKPGPVSRGLTWSIPHQPRLDWQMWFASYRSVAENAKLCVLIEGPKWGDAVFYGRWLLASAQVDRIWNGYCGPRRWSLVKLLT